MRSYTLVEFLFTDEIANTGDLVYGVSESIDHKDQVADAEYMFGYTIDNFNTHSKEDIKTLMNYVMNSRERHYALENYLDKKESE